MFLNLMKDVLRYANSANRLCTITLVACLAWSSLVQANSVAASPDFLSLPVFPDLYVEPESLFEYQIRLTGSGSEDIQGPVPFLRILNAPKNSQLTNNGDGTADFVWSPDMDMPSTTVLIVQSFATVDGRLLGTRRILLHRGGKKSQVAETHVADEPEALVTQTVDSGTAEEEGEADVQLVLQLEVDPLRATAASPTAAHNPKPEIAALPIQTIAAGTPYSLFIRATDPDGTVPLLQAVTLPAGATWQIVRADVAEFRWLPAAEQQGMTQLRLLATDARDESVTVERLIEFDIVISEQLTLTKVDAEAISLTDAQGLASGVATDTANPVIIEKLASVRGAKLEMESTVGFNPVPTQIVGSGQLVQFRVSLEEHTAEYSVVQIDRLPGTASFEINDDGSRTFRWQTSKSEQGDHLFRFTAIARDNVADRASMNVRVIVGDPTITQTQPDDFNG